MPWTSEVSSDTGCSPSGSSGHAGSRRSSGMALATFSPRSRGHVCASVSRRPARHAATTVDLMPTPLVDWLRAQDDDDAGRACCGCGRTWPCRRPPTSPCSPPGPASGPRCTAPATTSTRWRWPCSRRWSSRTPTASPSPRRRGAPAAGAGRARRRRCDAALAALRDRALAWEPPITTRAVGRAGGRATSCRAYPGGLGRPAPGLAASSALPRPARRGRSADERRVLDALAAGPPIGRSRGGRTRPGPSAGSRREGPAAARGRGDGRAAPPGGPRAARRAPDGRARRRPARTSRRATAGSTSSTGRPRAPRCEMLRQVELMLDVLGPHPARRAPLRRPGRARPAALAREMDADEPMAALLVELRGGGRPGGGDRGRRAGVGAHDRRRRLVARRPGAAVGGAGPGVAGPAPAARASSAPRDDAGRPIAALSDGRAPPDGPAGPPPGARRARRAAARARPSGRRQRWPTCWPGGRPGAAGGCATRSSPGRWPRRPCWVSSRSTRCPPRAGCCSTTRHRAGGRAARRAARARRPRAAAGRPDGRRARTARARAAASWTWSPRSSRRAAPPSTGSPRPPCAGRWTPGAPPPSCTSCSPPGRPRRCRRAWPTSSTTSRAGTGGCAAARRRRSCAPTTRC